MGPPTTLQPMPSNYRRRAPARIMAALTLLWLITIPSKVAAQIIVRDVTVQALVRPQGRQLQMLVRVPLGALRDVDLPTYGIGYLNLGLADSPLREAARLRVAPDLQIYEDGQPLNAPQVAAVRVSLPSDRSFMTYDGALAHIRSPRLPNDTELYWEQGVLDVLLEYSIRSDRSNFSIDTSLERPGLRVNTVLRFLPPESIGRLFEFPGNPGRVWLDPKWHQAARRFVVLGFEQIFDGLNHLVFLLCMVIPFRRARTITIIVTAFIVAHSVTLTASAFRLAPNVLWFQPFIETLVAVSIIYMAFENMLGTKVERRARSAFGFGLVHGLAFSFALPEMLQFGGAHVVVSRLSFNIGIEIGLLFGLVLLLPALSVLFRRVVAQRIGTIVLSVFIAHSGWHWMTERMGELSQYRFQWPPFDAFFFASAMRRAMLVVIIAGILRMGRGFLGPSTSRAEVNR